MKKSLIVFTGIMLIACSITGCGSKEKQNLTEVQTEDQDLAEDETGDQEQEEQEKGEVYFNTTTLTGEEIDSSIFEDYELTAINVWATWCGPCISEIPELAEVYKELPDGVNFIGICTDGETEKELAQEILESAGASYENIIANTQMNKDFLSSVQAIPTTIFVDKDGNLVGEPMVGVPSGDVKSGYLNTMEERLALLAE